VWASSRWLFPARRNTCHQKIFPSEWVHFPSVCGLHSRWLSPARRNTCHRKVFPSEWVQPPSVWVHFPIVRVHFPSEQSNIEELGKEGKGTNLKKNAIRESSLRKEAHTLKDPIRVPKHKSTNTQGVVYTPKHEVPRQGRFTW
jgi:hypothetical protein